MSAGPSAPDANESTLEIPVWVHGKRKWVTGITKKTTFDDLIYALLAQSDLLKTGDVSNSSSSSITGYAIAECVQSVPSSAETVSTQRIFKGRTKVIKVHKSWQFDKLPLTVLQLIRTSALLDAANGNTSTSKIRSKLFRRFLSTKSTTPDDGHQQKVLSNYQENVSILERQKRLLHYLDEKIHHAEKSVTSPTSHSIVTLNDVAHLLAAKPVQQEQLIVATQLCNSIFNIQDHINEKTEILYNVEQAISNELNHVLHQQQQVEALPMHVAENSAPSNDLITLKNAIYRSRELSRIQSKEMHDLDLSLREAEILLGIKYDELKYLEYETSSNTFIRSRSITPNVQFTSQPSSDEHRPHPTSYEGLDVAFTSMKEIDEDSGINSLTSEDSNHHSMPMGLPKMSTQLETLV